MICIGKIYFLFLKYFYSKLVKYIIEINKESFSKSLNFLDSNWKAMIFSLRIYGSSLLPKRT